MLLFSLMSTIDVKPVLKIAGITVSAIIGGSQLDTQKGPLLFRVAGKHVCYATLIKKLDKSCINSMRALSVFNLKHISLCT